ncbi:MAG: hypothetical protein ABJH08_05110 [Balneola sp.]
MLFGLPWWALIPLLAIGGGLFLEYRKQELKAEEKRMASSTEINELRRIIQNLKTRIEKIEGKVNSSAEKATKKEVPLDDIEIRDDYYSDEEDESTKRRVQN